MTEVRNQSVLLSGMLERKTNKILVGLEMYKEEKYKLREMLQNIEKFTRDFIHDK